MVRSPGVSASTSRLTLWRMTHTRMAVNSNAIQGITSGVTIHYALTGWQKALIAGNVAVAVIVVADAVLLLWKEKTVKA